MHKVLNDLDKLLTEEFGNETSKIDYVMLSSETLSQICDELNLGFVMENNIKFRIYRGLKLFGEQNLHSDFIKFYGLKEAAV